MSSISSDSCFEDISNWELDSTSDFEVEQIELDVAVSLDEEEDQDDGIDLATVLTILSIGVLFWLLRFTYDYSRPDEQFPIATVFPDIKGTWRNIYFHEATFTIKKIDETVIIIQWINGKSFKEYEFGKENPEDGLVYANATRKTVTMKEMSFALDGRRIARGASRELILLENPKLMKVICEFCLGGGVYEKVEEKSERKCALFL